MSGRDAAKELAERTANYKTAKMWVRQNQKPGVFGLPPLLEERRLEYGIPDGAFKMQAVYNRILLWQIPDDDSETYKGTSIIMTSRAQERERDIAPRGIIISAGLSALDYLRSNGMDLGHIVSFVRLSPYEWRCDIVSTGIPQECKILQAGDIIGSEDLAANLRSGKTVLKTVQSNGLDIHAYEADGQTTIPQDPRLASDY